MHKKVLPIANWTKFIINDLLVFKVVSIKTRCTQKNFYRSYGLEVFMTIK